MTAARRWVAPDPAFETAVRASFARQTMMATLGARIVHIAAGELDLAAPFSRGFGQQHGFWHAGAVASLADSANGYAAFTLAPAGSDVLAVEFKINLLAPARGARFLACGRVVRPGRTLTVCQAEVFAESAGDPGVAPPGAARLLIAIMSSTLIVRPGVAADRG
jgi:uncharacterized protein (TIGR00369 family)